MTAPSTTATDPLEALGRELAAINDEQDAIDTMATSDKGGIHDERVDYLEARRDAIEAMVATTKATSLAGALMQACLIRGLIETLIRGGTEGHRKRAALQCQFIGYSIADAIEEAASLDREELFRGNYYTGDDMSPLNPAKERRT